MSEGEGSYLGTQLTFLFPYVLETTRISPAVGGRGLLDALKPGHRPKRDQQTNKD